MSILQLTTLPQKLLMGGLGLGLIAAASFNVVQAVENRHLSKVNVNLDKRINDPKSGYIVRLSQSDTNTEVCKGEIVKQTKAIKDLGDSNARTVAAVQARYDTEHAARVRAENSAAAFLARKPQGATLEQRIRDVDAQILGDLK